MSIPFDQVCPRPKLAELHERDHAAIVLAGFISGALDADPEYFHRHIRDGLIKRLNDVRRTQGLKPYAPVTGRGD